MNYLPETMTLPAGVAVAPIAVGMRVGVFCDLSNIYQNGGQRLRYDVLRQYAQLYGDVLRLNAYLSYDADRAEQDRPYREKALGFQEALREMGWQVIQKEVKWYQQENGSKIGKANADVDMAVDILTSAANLDMVIIVTGDGDFVRPIQVVRDMGRRVEGIGLDNVSGDLKRAVDSYVSGFILPNLVPINGKGCPDEQGPGAYWGEYGSYVRGVCNFHHPKDSYGFLNFLPRLSRDHWLSDPRTPGSPFASAFFHDSNLPEGVCGRNLSKRSVFEFQLEHSDRDNSFIAKNIRLVTAKS